VFHAKKYCFTQFFVSVKILTQKNWFWCIINHFYVGKQSKKIINSSTYILCQYFDVKRFIVSLFWRKKIYFDIFCQFFVKNCQFLRDFLLFLYLFNFFTFFWIFFKYLFLFIILIVLWFILNFFEFFLIMLACRLH